MRALFFSVALVLAACSPAPDAQAPSIQIENAWAAPTPNGVEVSAGYLTIVNDGEAADRLLSASSPRAAQVQIHDMAMDGDVMRMREVEALEAPAGERVTFAPGGLHLMFMGVSQPFAEGEEIPATLTFERAGEIAIALPVRRAGASDADHETP